MSSDDNKTPSKRYATASDSSENQQPYKKRAVESTPTLTPLEMGPSHETPIASVDEAAPVG